MRVYIIASLIAIAYSARVKGSTPTFSMSQERSIDGSPKIHVVFQNGVSDTLILSSTERDMELLLRTGIEECRYFGHLENEPEACVAMTGCPGSEDVEFTILSKNIQETPAFLWTKDGSVELVILEARSAGVYSKDRNDSDDNPKDHDAFHPDHSEEKNRNDDIPKDHDTFHPGSNNINNGELRANPPTGMQVSLQVGYGDNFANEVKTEQKQRKYINDGIHHAQAYFCHSSLGSQVDLHIKNIKHIKGKQFWARYQGANKDAQLSVNPGQLTKEHLGSANLMVFVGRDLKSSTDGVGGVASVGVVCAGSKKDKWSINEWQDSVSAFGSLVAHELGHNFGIEHDFSTGGASYHSSCNCQGVMSYQGSHGCPFNLPAKWSACSRSYFLNHYSANANHWCLPAYQPPNFPDGKPPSCSTAQQCIMNTFNDGKCDDYNNKELCSFDGGDCCDHETGWDSRCKQDYGDCTCKEPCKDKNSNCDAEKGHCGTSWTVNGSGAPMWTICRRTCNKCQAGTCKDVGTFQYPSWFCGFIKNQGMCDRTASYCGKQSCGNLCKATCGKC